MPFRRRAARVFRPLLRHRYAAALLLFYCASFFGVFTRPPWRWGFAALLALCCSVGYLRAPRPPATRAARRRRMEAAFCALAALDLLARAGPEGLRLLAFPLFLFFVHAGHRVRELGILLAVEALLALAGAGTPAAWRGAAAPERLLLWLWTALAALSRAREAKKRKEVADRLSLYEREAGVLDRRSAEVGEALRADERKRAHLCSMIREREESFRDLLGILKRTFEPHSCALYLYDASRELFVLKEVLTDSDRFSEERTQPAEGIFRAVAREEAPVRMVSASGELRGLLYYAAPPLVRSVAALPLRSNGWLKGVLILDRLEAKPFSDEECETISQVGAQLGRAMDNAEALHAYFELQEELSAFFAAGNALNRSLRVDDVVQTLLQSSGKIVRYDWGAVILHEARTEENRIAAEGGKDPNGWAGRTFACAPERSLASWVVRNGAPLSYTGFRSRGGKTTLFPKNFRLGNVYESVLILPMHVKGEALGALLLAGRRNHAFGRSARKMLEVVAMMAGAALKNARMVHELERLATTDGLTGLANHRAFQEALASELERAGRHPAPVSLLLVDVDRFKQFNDEFGHPVGDFVLKEIARCLNAGVRKIDTVARYGGEEFAVILANTAGEGARKLAERTVREIAGTKLRGHGLSLNVTVSVGVASYPADAAAREDLIECADRALYESKRAGRNRVTAYRGGLGKWSARARQERLILGAEEELRCLVDQEGPTV